MLSLRTSASASDWQVNGKRAAATGLALDADGTVMRCDDKFHNAQPQTAPSSAARHSLIHLKKPFEDSFGIARRQTDAIVPYAEDQAPVVGACNQRDLFFFAGILEGIVQ